MTMTLEDEIISMPTERKPRKFFNNKKSNPFNTDDLEAELEGVPKKEEHK